MNLGHDRLSTYSIGRDLSKRQWQSLGWQCLHQGLVAQDMEFGGLHLTRKAWAVFRGEANVFGWLRAPEPPQRSVSKKRQVMVDYDRDLFELLRQKRLELAREQGVPPFVIFADRTLAEMASVYPRTMTQLLDIHGVGQVKGARYGEHFTDIIGQYCNQHGIAEERAPAVSAQPASKDTAGFKRYQ